MLVADRRRLPTRWSATASSPAVPTTSFQQLALQQRLADQYTAAADTQQASDFTWGLGDPASGSRDRPWLRMTTATMDRTIDAPAARSRLHQM